MMNKKNIPYIGILCACLISSLIAIFEHAQIVRLNQKNEILESDFREVLSMHLKSFRIIGEFAYGYFTPWDAANERHIKIARINPKLTEEYLVGADFGDAPTPSIYSALYIMYHVNPKSQKLLQRAEELRGKYSHQSSNSENGSATESILFEIGYRNGLGLLIEDITGKRQRNKSESH